MPLINRFSEVMKYHPTFFDRANQLSRASIKRGRDEGTFRLDNWYLNLTVTTLDMFVYHISFVAQGGFKARTWVYRRPDMDLDHVLVQFAEDLYDHINAELTPVLSEWRQKGDEEKRLHFLERNGVKAVAYIDMGTPNPIRLRIGGRSGLREFKLHSAPQLLRAFKKNTHIYS